LEVGRIVAGKYRLRKQIGTGAMGAVWAAVHEALDRQVAIKFLMPSQEDAEIASARFVREAKSAARVKHRFVVDVFDFGVTDDGLYYMVLELLQGQELAATMQNGQPWRAREAIHFLMQCLSGLDAVHQAGLVHRDLKPENVFVMQDNDGRFPKLLDFGISKSAEAPAASNVQPGEPPAKRPRMKQLTRVGVTLGTPCYMSPEQLRGARDLDGRADLYSVGVLLYQWLSGHVPYVHDNLAELAQQVASRSAPQLVDMRPELGQALSQVVQRAIAPTREERFQSAHEMREALAAAMAQVPAQASCAREVNRLRPAPQKTQLMLAPLSSPLGEQMAAMRRIAPRFLRDIPRPWMWAIASCFALLVLAFSLLRSARPEVASAEAEPLVIGGPPKVSAPVAAPQPAPVVLPLSTVTSDSEPKRPERRKKKKARNPRPETSASEPSMPAFEPVP
jgi:serine/threonine protein kinase